MSEPTAEQTDAVAVIAARHGVDARLVSAMITVESEWRELTMRFEASYPYLSDVWEHARANVITVQTERALERMSWGLMQIMGATARWRGYEGPLGALLDRATNLEWGVRHLAAVAVDYPDNWSDQIAAYNRGSVVRRANGRYVNQRHVDRVLAVLARS